MQSILCLEAVDSKGDPDIAQRSFAKLTLANRATELIPDGRVSFDELSRYPLIKNMVPEIGKTEIQTLLVMLISNFCRSFNVVRNMNEDQVIECAMYLLDECKDFTLEDYVIMFTLGKRAKIGEVLDHIDIQVISNMHQQYLARRISAFQKIHDAESKVQFEAKVARLTEKDVDAGDKAMQAIKQLVSDIAERERLEAQQWRQRLKATRDTQIIELIERDAMLGIAPSKELREFYLNHIKATKN